MKRVQTKTSKTRAILPPLPGPQGTKQHKTAKHFCFLFEVIEAT
jgi:hypothetical protein